MQVIYKKTSELIPYENNPRINEEAVEFVKNSIKQFGFKNPIIIDKNNVIVAGHTRLKAAERLKMVEVPCIIADDLSEEQIKAFRLADNKVAEFSDWDLDKLQAELDGIDLDMQEFGFDKIDEILEEEFEEEKPEIEFSEVIGEEHNYIVLYFDNEVDWLQAESLFDIKPVKCGSTRKDGKITESMNRVGIGRVINGAEAINKLMGDKQ